MDDTLSPTVTHTIAADQVTPVRAYAALRSFAPRQSSFLLESMRPETPGGRFSIVAYRAQSESLYPAGGDALSMLIDELSASNEGPPSGTVRPPAEALARLLSRATAGFIAYDAIHPMLKIKPWESEGPMARTIQGATVVVFDHLAGTCTIAGPTRSSVNRCAWEMTRGPELRPIRAPDPQRTPEHVDVSMSDETFAARVRRAQEKIAAGQVEQLSLCRIFRTPPRNAETLDVYRALRLLDPSPYLFFFDFVESPMTPPQTLLGVAAGLLVQGDDGAMSPLRIGEQIRASFPAAATTGSPRAQAAQLIRELEAEPRGLFGGAIGFVLPGGQIGLAAADRTVVLEHAYLQVAGAAAVRAGTDGEAAAEEARQRAMVGLAAIRAAQDAADAREAADAEKRAKEAAKAEAASASTQDAGVQDATASGGAGTDEPAPRAGDEADGATDLGAGDDPAGAGENA
ncbi:MAG: chorismate-binding protein [Byssovorax sp.]